MAYPAGAAEFSNWVVGARRVLNTSNTLDTLSTRRDSGQTTEC